MSRVSSDHGEVPPLIVRLLTDLIRTPRKRGESDPELVRRWLAQTELGSGFANHLADEADLLEMAANRLNISGDDELREISAELGNIAGRLRTLVGVGG